jgi:hypothetical protein
LRDSSLHWNNPGKNKIREERGLEPPSPGNPNTDVSPSFRRSPEREREREREKERERERLYYLYCWSLVDIVYNLTKLFSLKFTAP